LGRWEAILPGRGVPDWEVARMSETIAHEIREQAEALSPQLVANRRSFHKHAEAGWTEFRTASLIARRLVELNYVVTAGRDVCAAEARMGLPSESELETHWQRACTQGGDPEYLELARGGFTSVVGTLDCGPGPTIGLRFDIDALGVQESDDLGHRPQAEGFASVNTGVCHACGHDGHAAIGLGVAALLAQWKSQLRGRVKLIFQPAEEGVRGARSMVASGVLDGIDYLIGQHLMTGWALGEIAPGMGGYAATRKLDIRFHGAPAHAGGSPEKGNNALLAAATAALNLHALPRHQDGFTRVNVGTLHAGTGRNVIPAEALLAAEVRGETTKLCDSMYAGAARVVQSAAQMHGCTFEIVPMGQAGTASSDGALAGRVRTLAKRVLDAEAFDLAKLGGSEDFTEMMAHVQSQGGLTTNIGIGADFHGIRKGEKPRDHMLAAHTGTYDFDERAMTFAVRLFVHLVLDLQSDPSTQR